MIIKNNNNNNNNMTLLFYSNLNRPLKGCLCKCIFSIIQENNLERIYSKKRCQVILFPFPPPPPPQKLFS